MVEGHEAEEVKLGGQAVHIARHDLLAVAARHLRGGQGAREHARTRLGTGSQDRWGRRLLERYDEGDAVSQTIRSAKMIYQHRALLALDSKELMESKPMSRPLPTLRDMERGRSNMREAAAQPVLPSWAHKATPGRFPAAAHAGRPGQPT